MESTEKCVCAGSNHVGIGACAPIHFAVITFKTDIRGGNTVGAIALHTVLSKHLQGVFFAGEFTKGIVNSTKSTITLFFKFGFFTVTFKGNINFYRLIFSHKVKIRNGNTAVKI